MKESNAGVPRVLASLRPEEHTCIHVDPNATYREYIMIMLPNNEQLRLISSDEMQELKAIEIHTKGQDKWYCKDISNHPAPEINFLTRLRSGCTLPPKTCLSTMELLRP